MNPDNPWQTLGTRIVYENSWLRLREDRVIRPDGKEGIYGVVEMRPSVGVVALNAKDEVALVGQWRYAHEKFSWEIPTGGSSANDAAIIDAARRELEEETGLQAARWTPLGSIDNSNGVTTDVAHLYLARQLTFLQPKQDPEERIVTRWVAFPRVVQMVMDGEITESCSVAAILKVDRLRRGGEERGLPGPSDGD
jgi:8-oxo-dGTP pyrophosphatase MutT (NUDIX family)